VIWCDWLVASLGRSRGVATCDFGWNEGSVALDLR